MNINKYIDHTNLKQNAVQKDIKKLCKEAKQESFASVVVDTSWVAFCHQQLKDSKVKVCSVTGFPLGTASTSAKVFEAQQAIKDGADEIDMVINVGKLLDNEFNYIVNEIKAIKKVIGNKILKVILETCLLNTDQIKKAVLLSIKANADFVKTSTGFSEHGATIKDVKIMIKEANGHIKVKAAGGIKTKKDCQKYINLGVERIGTSSAANY